MAKPTVLDRIKELDAEKARLMDEAKTNALATAEGAIAELNALGFSYRLVEAGKAPRASTPAPTGKRRTGIRDEVLSIIASSADGISRADLLAKLDASDKSAQQAVSNAVSALKKDGKISGEGGHYRSA